MTVCPVGLTARSGFEKRRVKYLILSRFASIASRFAPHKTCERDAKAPQAFKHAWFAATEICDSDGVVPDAAAAG